MERYATAVRDKAIKLRKSGKTGTQIENETGVRVRSMDITTVRALSECLCETLAGAKPAAR